MAKYKKSNNRYAGISKYDEKGVAIKAVKQFRIDNPGALVFDSRLEYNTWKCLIAAGLKVQHHVERTELQAGFRTDRFESYKHANVAIQKITYEVDFVVVHNGINFCIETKGHAEEVFKLKWKMYLKLVHDDPKTVPCLVYTLGEVHQLIEFIKQYKPSEDNE